MVYFSEYESSDDFTEDSSPAYGTLEYESEDSFSDLEIGQNSEEIFLLLNTQIKNNSVVDV